MSEQYEQADTPFMSTAVKHGLIIGIILIVISLAYQLAGLTSNMFFSMLVGLLSILLYAVASFRAIKEHRDYDLGGHITLGRGFLTGWVAAMVAGAVAAIFSVVYVNFIDPGSVQDAMDGAREMMEQFGTDEDIIDEAMKDAEERMSSPVRVFFSGFITSAVVGAIAAVIMGAVMKKEPELV